MQLDIDLSVYQKNLSLSVKDGKKYLFDPVRKAEYLLQPEEFIRQLWIQYLHKEHNIGFAALGVEKTIKIQSVSRRYDLVLYHKGVPEILFEFKSYKNKLTSEVAQQVAHYNMELKVPYIILSNGESTYGYQIDHVAKEIKALSRLPFGDKK